MPKTATLPLQQIEASNHQDASLLRRFVEHPDTDNAKRVLSLERKAETENREGLRLQHNTLGMQLPPLLISTFFALASGYVFLREAVSYLSTGSLVSLGIQTKYPTSAITIAAGVVLAASVIGGYLSARAEDGGSISIRQIKRQYAYFMVNSMYSDAVSAAKYLFKNAEKTKDPEKIGVASKALRFTKEKRYEQLVKVLNGNIKNPTLNSTDLVASLDEAVSLSKEIERPQEVTEAWQKRHAQAQEWYNSPAETEKRAEQARIAAEAKRAAERAEAMQYREQARHDEAKPFSYYGPGSTQWDMEYQQIQRDRKIQREGHL